MVGRRAALPAPRGVLLGLGLPGGCDAEVHDLHAAAGREHDVAGLDLPVDDADAVAASRLSATAAAIRAAEDAWNTRDPERVSLAYTVDSQWRNRSEIFQGRPQIVEFLTRKWNRELDYRLIKELWAFTANRIAVRFAYEYHDDSGNWFRAYGNENWEFGDDGLMRQRHASINDLPIREPERKFHWDRSGPRPADHPGLTDLGL
jgi:uncharacterized protein